MSEAPNSAYLLGKRRTLIVFAGLLLGMLLAALNQTIVATALRTSSATSAAPTTTRGSPRCSRS